MTIALIFLGICVLLLTVACVGLFAMMGELSSQVGSETPNDGAGDGALIPVTGARTNAYIREWPPELLEVRDAEYAVLVVLSSACASCSTIAARMRDALPATPGISGISGIQGVVISTSDSQVGEDFIDRYRLRNMGVPITVDVSGQWLVEQLNVNVSPAVIRFNAGLVVGADSFTSMGALTRLGVGADGGASLE